MSHQLGQTGRDIVSGYEGIVMARSEYLTGCAQILLVPRTLDEKGERREGEWFDDVRIEITDPKLIVFPHVAVDRAASMPVAATGRDEAEAPKR